MEKTQRNSSDLEKLKESIASDSFPFWLFLALWFGQLCLALAPSWGDGTYYDYGYMVILVAPYFFFVRWQEIKGREEMVADGIPKLVRSPLVLSVFFLFTAIIVVLRLIQNVDSGWRPPLMLHALLVISFIALCLGLVVGWKNTLRFLPCALLVLLAVPLPSAIEFSLIHGLTERVVDTAVFANRMLGLPVTSSGETLFANGIPLHVSEGCSGIRSFQSSIFAGFVLGEFVRLSFLNRFLLLAFSLLTAFCMNCLRVIYLVQHAAGNPEADLQKIHDVSGYVSLTLTFCAIFGIASLLKKAETGLAQASS